MDRSVSALFLSVVFKNTSTLFYSVVAVYPATLFYSVGRGVFSGLRPVGGRDIFSFFFLSLLKTGGICDFLFLKPERDWKWGFFQAGNRLKIDWKQAFFLYFSFLLIDKDIFKKAELRHKSFRTFFIFLNS